MLNSIFTTAGAAPISMGQLAACTFCSLALGVLTAAIHSYKNRYSPNFLITLALLPTIIQAVILLVNGNLGTGVAVMGAFSLIRFRSAPGDAREIGSIFLAMAVGLATGTGYLGIACFLLLVVGAASLIYARFQTGGPDLSHKELRITIPEDLDYYGIFDDLFLKFTTAATLLRVRTVEMGSLYELHYKIRLRSPEREKEFLDLLRCRNGNLTISLTLSPTSDQGSL